MLDENSDSIICSTGEDDPGRLWAVSSIRKLDNMPKIVVREPGTTGGQTTGGQMDELMDVIKLRDNGGRRAGLDRRQFSYSGYLPERRSGVDRRLGFDRRKPRFSAVPFFQITPEE